MPEIWDVYDENRNLTGKTAARKDKWENGEFHLVADLFFLNSKGETLLQRRSDEKENHPGIWNCTGGCALRGENSEAACIRECREELGFLPNLKNSRLLFAEINRERHFIRDNYLIFQDMPVEKMVFQPEEVQDALWILPEKIRENEKIWQDMCIWSNWAEVYPLLCLESMRIRIPRGIYRHYKGKRYEVEGLALHSETLEPMVIYRALYGAGEIWVRPASMWNEKIVTPSGECLRFALEEKI